DVINAAKQLANEYWAQDNMNGDDDMNDMVNYLADVLNLDLMEPTSQRIIKLAKVQFGVYD
ncbi:MAG: hypothetical protein GY700_01490, partial [Propionibacteriaceae bacterium]|nr:hypothetical protein [Propionibacteriaceae bacterium]